MRSVMYPESTDWIPVVCYLEKSGDLTCKVTGTLIGVVSS